MLKRKRRHKLGTSNTDPARFNKSQIKIYGYLIPISIVMLLPIIYIVVSAFKPMDELFAYPPRFYVKNPTFDNFRYCNFGRKIFIQHFREYRCHYVFKCVDICVRRVRFI